MKVVHITILRLNVGVAYFSYKQTSLVQIILRIHFYLMCIKVREARKAAAKAQQLLENVADRKRNKQQETGGLVITNGIYGNCKALKKGDEWREANDELASQVLDVTLSLNFLVNDSGQLKVCFFDYTIMYVIWSTVIMPCV